jgi:hypothetical protein
LSDDKNIVRFPTLGAFSQLENFEGNNLRRLPL